MVWPVLRHANAIVYTATSAARAFARLIEAGGKMVNKWLTMNAGVPCCGDNQSDLHPIHRFFLGNHPCHCPAVAQAAPCFPMIVRKPAARNGAVAALERFRPLR